MRGRLPILVIEKEPAEQEKIITSFLHNQISNPVHVASNADGAFDYLSSIFYNPTKRRNPLPGVIILSHCSSEPTAITIFKELKAHHIYNQIPTVIFSDSAEESDRETFHALGCNGYFQKPNTQEEYYEVIQVIYEFMLYLSVPSYSMKD